MLGSLIDLQNTYSKVFSHTISTHIGGSWHVGKSIPGRISLDYLSLRSTYYDGQIYTLEDAAGNRLNPSHKIGLILGGSTAFGSYSSTDEFTLASLLSEESIKYFTIAQPGDTFLAQATKCTGIKNMLNLECDTILGLVGFNEIFWACTCPILTPFGYVEKQRHFFLGDNILNHLNELEDYQNNLYKRCLESGVFQLNPIYDLANGDLEANISNLEECVRVIIDHFSQSIRILRSFYPEAKITLVLQPSATSEVDLLSNKEIKAVNYWLTSRSQEQKNAFKTQIKYLKPLVYKELCNLQEDALNVINLSSIKDLETKDSFFYHDECHLTDEGFARCAKLIALKSSSIE